MASTSITTTDQGDQFFADRSLVRAGSRLYCCFHNGSNYVYYYSDNSGSTWTGPTTIHAGGTDTPRGGAFYDSVNGRLNFVYAGGNNVGADLRYRAITSNVASGTPGALSTVAIIDAGGANLGVVRPYAFHSATGTRPRYWIVAMKATAASTYEARAWSVDVTTVTAADTAGNWLTTNFTNMDGDSNTESEHLGVGAYWTVGGNAKVTLIVGDGEQIGALRYRACTFDPTVATPTPGTFTTITTSGGVDWFSNGAPMTCAAIADYFVFGRLDPSTGAWDWFKTVDGTTWTNPSGWTSLTMGRAQLAVSGSDFFILHSESYGAWATTAQQLYWRKITTSSNSMSSASLYSDNNGNGICAPIDTGTTSLFGLYRADTAANYTVRSDFTAITAAPSGTTSSMTLMGVG